jgi:hypothetical protein
MEVQDLTGEPLVAGIDVNQYAVATQGETLAVRCPGRAETHVNLPRGTFNVTCLQPCVITGAGWTATCIDRLYVSRHYVMPEVRFPQHFNFSQVKDLYKLRDELPHFNKFYVTQELTWDVPPAGPAIHPMAHFKIRSGPGILTLVNMVFVIMLLAAVLILLVKCRAHSLLLRVLARKYSAVPMDALEDAPETEKLALEAPTAAEQTPSAPKLLPQPRPATQASIWPRLTPWSDGSSEAQDVMQPV